MNYSKQDQLEACVERHRADFDLHEPRPELWAALEKQLHDSTTDSAEPVMSVVGGDRCRCQPAGLNYATCRAANSTQAMGLGRAL